MNYLEDHCGLACLREAFRSPQRWGLSFGAVITNRSGNIIGRGRNRRALLLHRKIFPGVGYGVHAEEAAIIGALRKGHKNLENKQLFILGVVLGGANKGKLTTRSEPHFLCVRCARSLVKYGLSVNVPTIAGWVKLSPELALLTAEQNHKPGRWRDFPYRKETTL